MNSTRKPSSILVVGGHDAGKTHYGGQLLGRLRDRQSNLRLRSAIDNISPFEAVLDKLGQGISAPHTSMNTYDELVLPVESASGEEMNLLWPDYGGEQITNRIMAKRQVPSEWQSRIKASDGWLLFIRLEQLRDFKDVLTRPIAEIVTSAQKNSDKKVRWSDQALYIELLQFFLFAKGAGVIQRVRKPSLLVLLSCWDEMDYAKDKAPIELLSLRMPMFLDFVTSIWAPEHLSIMGLSSLSKHLKDDTPDNEYLDRGPESFGYVVLPDGSRSPDLTLPVFRLSQMSI